MLKNPGIWECYFPCAGIGLGIIYRFCYLSSKENHFLYSAGVGISRFHLNMLLWEACFLFGCSRRSSNLMLF